MKKSAGDVPKHKSLTRDAVSSAKSLSFRTLSLRNSFYSAASSFRLNDSSQSWTCPECSYQNEFSSSDICSICGAHQHGKVQPRPSIKEEEEDNAAEAATKPTELQDTGSFSRKGKFQVNKFEEFLNFPPDRPDVDDEVVGKPPSRTPSKDATTTNLKPEKPSENESSPDGEIDEVEKPKTGTSLPASRKSALMGAREMSFASWSKNEAENGWVCAICTYANEDPLHLSCAICGQARGQKPVSELEGTTSSGQGSLSETDQELYLEKQREQSEKAALEAINSERLQEFVENQMEHLEEIEARREQALLTCEEQMSQLLAKGSKSQQETQRTLDECKRALAELERMHRDEVREQEVMEAVQQQRKEIIEEEEGLGTLEENDDGPRKLTRKRTLLWTAQQHMLDDRRRSLHSRETRMQSIRELQKEVEQASESNRSL